MKFGSKGGKGKGERGKGKGERGGKTLRIHFTFPNTPKNTVTMYHYNLHIQRLSEVVLIFIW